MLIVDEEDTHAKRPSMYDNFADKLEWFLCDYFACFRIFALCHDCHNKNNNNKNKNKNKSVVAISQSASDIILQHSDTNIHPLHE